MTGTDIFGMLSVACTAVFIICCLYKVSKDDF